MKIKESFQRNIAVLTISGNMMGGPETTALHEKVKSLIADGAKNVVIDLKGVKWLNSSGLGVLMACYTSISSAEGKLKLSSVAEKVQSVMMITKMIKIFDTYESADRAVASFENEA
ncbi:MAG: STAS domain-containing protein [Calditrichaeota bacterium]|nr:STAS domain-containing protein [Calditrichota bacterium]MCB0269346.1 STAS domain-containing protein [Calditrichota bacterium]MCB0285512.1 STAS domain-containing protein [Calditrichota bacterium]MCB0299323.1 STAS domain-containing protein [Calditrichota bacterium]MCB9067143.1 STAS domain-containing protein [Calditrichia bacterium]